MKTMNICDIKTDKNCPGLKTAAPSQQEVNPQNYRLEKISKIKVYSLDEISKQENLPINFQLLATTSSTIGIELIAIVFITDSASIPAFASSSFLPMGVILSGMSILLSLANDASR